MAINARQALLLLVLLPMFLHLQTNEAYAVEPIKFDVHFPPVAGDPARADPFLALITLSGGRDPSLRFNKDGKWRLKNAVGPFNDIDIWMAYREHPILQFSGPFTEGGVVTQVVSRVTRREVSFEIAVKQIKDLWIALLQVTGIRGFDEESSTSNTYTVYTKNPTRGGWLMEMSVRQVNEDNYEYCLFFRRKSKPEAAKIKDVDIEVDV